jgi:hypothetical protein
VLTRASNSLVRQVPRLTCGGQARLQFNRVLMDPFVPHARPHHTHHPIGPGTLDAPGLMVFRILNLITRSELGLPHRRLGIPSLAYAQFSLITPEGAHGCCRGLPYLGLRGLCVLGVLGASWLNAASSEPLPYAGEASWSVRVES